MPTTATVPDGMTAEEATKAIADAQKMKEDRAKGTSVEHNDKVLKLSPEMQDALASCATEAVKKMFDLEVEMRQKVFHEEAAKARSTVSDAVEAGHIKRDRRGKENQMVMRFLKALQKRDHAGMRAVYEEESKFLGRDTLITAEDKKDLRQRAMGAATAGDEFIPEVWTNQLIENIERLGLARRLCRVIPMTSDTMKFPNITTGLTAYEVAGGAQITAADLVTATVTLSTRKLATITAFYNELLVNSDPALVPLLTEQAAIAIAAKEDDLVLTGSGSTVSGILESATNNVVNGGSATSGNTTIADVDFDDMHRLIDALDSQYVDEGCGFFFNKKVLFHLMNLASANGYLWSPPAASNPGTIRAFPYYTSSKMPSAPGVTTAYAAFGNMKHFYLGDRGVYTVALGTEGTVGSDNLFEKAMSALRVTELVGFVLSDAEGFSILKTATS